ncbi:3589_t:CDS:1, partial [Acaulospora morrowiae]
RWTIPKEVLGDTWEPKLRTIEKLDNLTVNQWLNKWEVFGKQEIIKQLKNKWENPRPTTLEEMIEKTWDKKYRKSEKIGIRSAITVEELNEELSQLKKEEETIKREP